VVNDNSSISHAARLFGQSLPPTKHLDSQEALRFARWFGEERPVADIRPSDLETYVDTFGATSPNAMARADALKGFLAFAHKQKMMPERLVSHVRVRRAGTRARPGVTAPGTPEVRVTGEGKEALEAELDGLKLQRPKIAAALHDAMADKDFRENAPLDAAREAQGQLEARIRELEGMLRHAVVVENEQGKSGDAARVGCSVVLINLNNGSTLSYQLVNAAEARAGSGRLSVESPVGQAIVGHRVGDEVHVTAPSGIVRFRIERVEL
jgi:transcription elongation factor GreA